MYTQYTRMWLRRPVRPGPEAPARSPARGASGPGRASAPSPAILSMSFEYTFGMKLIHTYICLHVQYWEPYSPKVLLYIWF